MSKKVKKRKKKKIVKKIGEKLSLKFKLRMFLGGVLFWIGVGIILSSYTGMTGLVISTGVGKTIGSILGLAFVVGGVGLIALNKFDYYESRFRELARNVGDAYVSQWELDGLLNEFNDRDYEIEHGKNAPTMHPSGSGPSQRHVLVQKDDFKKHLFITTDPYDPRLHYVGVKQVGDKIERVKSRVYHKQHPRKSGRGRKRFSGITKVLFEKRSQEVA